MGAVASCGLQLYQFGYTISIPLFEGRLQEVKSARVHEISSTSVNLFATFSLQIFLHNYAGSWRPISFYDRVKYNSDGGMHTLCLLDIKVCWALLLLIHCIKSSSSQMNRNKFILAVILTAFSKLLPTTIQNYCFLSFVRFMNQTITPCRLGS